ncbi:MAG TPA: hypothetical protein PL182_05210 [Pseudobdellovibrionaceae bacterium]|nr:hypothetical protein [Pseudobdellovibrionaceae bacterium]
MSQKRSWTGAWIVGTGVVAASALLGFWFLPERGRADIEFAKEFSWIKETGVDAIVSAGEDLPDFEMIRKMDRLEARHD